MESSDRQSGLGLSFWRKRFSWLHFSALKAADVAKWQTQRTLNCGFSDFCALHSRSNRSQFTWVNCPKFANFVCTEGSAEMTSLLHKFLHMNAADSGKSRSGFWAIEKKRFRKSRC